MVCLASLVGLWSTFCVCSSSARSWAISWSLSIDGSFLDDLSEYSASEKEQAELCPIELLQADC